MRYILTLLCCMALLAGCASDNPASSNANDTALVLYEVRGVAFGGDVGINYMLPGGVMASDFPASLPWAEYLGEVEAGESLVLEAWCSTPSSGAWLTVTIYKDGEEYRTATATGPYPYAVVTGTS